MADEMTPTEDLRARLDELGVEYTANDEEHVKETCWPYMGELMAIFAEYDNGTTRFACDTWCFTPEQAIAATVGVTEEEADSRDLMEAIRDDDGVRYSMDEVMDIMRKDAGTCTIEPDGYYGEQFGVYKCSNCGKWWHFECDGPKEHGWKYCPHCRARIKEDAE